MNASAAFRFGLKTVRRITNEAVLKDHKQMLLAEAAFVL